MGTIRRVTELALSGNLSTAAGNRLRVRRGFPRALYPNPMPSRENWSARRINTIHQAFPDMRRYLEVGVMRGRTFEDVSLPERVAVEPLPLFDRDSLPGGAELHVMTSDEYFGLLPASTRLDIVFLDGLHTYEQTYADLCNALRYCNEGAILMDDVVPIDSISAMRDQDESYARRRSAGSPERQWHGDVFRTAVCVQRHHPELDFVTLTTGGNPQMLLWKRDPEVSIAPVDRSTLAGLSSVLYEEVFEGGTPPEFRPTTERVGLVMAVEALGKHR